MKSFSSVCALFANSEWSGYLPTTVRKRNPRRTFLRRIVRVRRKVETHKRKERETHNHDLWKRNRVAEGSALQRSADVKNTNPIWNATTGRPYQMGVSTKKHDGRRREPPNGRWKYGGTWPTYVPVSPKRNSGREFRIFATPNGERGTYQFAQTALRFGDIEPISYDRKTGRNGDMANPGLLWARLLH